MIGLRNKYLRLDGRTDGRTDGQKNDGEDIKFSMVEKRQQGGKTRIKHVKDDKKAKNSGNFGEKTKSLAQF